MKTQTGNYETGDAAFAVNWHGRITLWNSAAEKTLGYPADAALGQHCWKLLCGNDTYGNRYCCKHCSLRKMAFRHKPPNGFKVIYKTASEERKQFLVSCLTIFNTCGGKLLLHICRSEDEILENRNNPVINEYSTSCHNGTLTRREIETLTLLAGGKSTREIASMLGISVSTARNHIHHVLHKLHVHTRLEAVMLGKHLDLI